MIIVKILNYKRTLSPPQKMVHYDISIAHSDLNTKSIFTKKYINKNHGEFHNDTCIN